MSPLFFLPLFFPLFFQDVRTANPAVPWQLAADMRNKLIHGMT
jgi:uncharacterized protein with HEPN domain